MKNKIGFVVNLELGKMKAREALRALVDIGYEAVEYSLVDLNPERMTLQQMRNLVKMTEAQGLIISEWMVQREFVHLDESIRRKGLTLTLDCIKAASDLGIGIINCYTGPAPFMGLGSPCLHKEISEGKGWWMVLDAYDKIVPLAEKCNVRIAVEAVYGMVCREYYTLQELLHHYDSDYLGVNYDPSHMELHYNSVGWTIRQLGGRIFHVHVKDVAGVPGYKMGDTFIFPLLGEGRVDWPDFFAAMDEIKYEGCFSLECESFDYYKRTLRKNFKAVAEICFRDFKSLIQSRIKESQNPLSSGRAIK
ncbi:MAG: sugar phosphate isomerase/epimerase [Deltaproteobacteria bacterium]|nr:MAG: sugar phosphate isomerase/epimerase [Deltaproteobacteria bacterium]